MIVKTYDDRYNMAGDRMKETGLIDKSIDFGVRIVKLYLSLLKTKHEVTQPHFGAQRRSIISRQRRHPSTQKKYFRPLLTSVEILL